MEKLPKILRELRKQYGYTLKYVANLLDISYQAYQAYELGTAYPPIQKLIKLADIFDVSIDYLLGRKEY